MMKSCLVGFISGVVVATAAMAILTAGSVLDFATAVAKSLDESHPPQHYPHPA